jgi:hypothetical protein
MMRLTPKTRQNRTLARAGVLSLLFLALPAIAAAQVVHSVSFGAGIFWPRSFDTRVEGDVLVANLTQPDIPGFPGTTSSLDFGADNLSGQIGKFRSYPFFGEWHIGFSDRLEAGVGVGYFGKKVDSRYRDLVNSARNNEDIRQTIRLRAIPITGVVRFLPLADPAGVQPYVGAGVAIIPFKYSETGEFVDLNDLVNLPIFNDRFETSGTAFGGLLLGGIRLPLGGDVYAFNIEGRYQFASGDTGGADNGFLGDKIDLSGGSLNFSFLVRF